ncbi:XRE family transcriptional regulator [Streptomyces sp. 184]|uniref:XRE family transcriptional regulator n=1 Tax=Streptomyces sp. 184 TaxID=1827526 RepID=UPI0038922FF5
MTRNMALAAAMAELEMTAPELAGRVNREIELLTGRPGVIDDRMVRRWLSGGGKWPHAKQRICLERVFDRPAVDLGFVPRRRSTPESTEAQVRRRTFLTATTGTTLAVTAAHAPRAAAARPGVGLSDLERLRDKHVRLIREGNRSGGTPAVIKASEGLAEEIQHLIADRAVSGRVSQRLYGLAPGAMSTASFAALDARAPDHSRALTDRAVTLAGMSNDSATVFRVWNNMAMISQQRENYTESAAAAQAARSTSVGRGSPLFSSLATARMAIATACLHDSRKAERLLSSATSSFERAGHDDTPAWADFYDIAELDGLSGITYMNLGRPQRAEYHFHRTLAQLRPGYARNRALYTASAALAQARQGELEAAVDTADRACKLAEGVPGSRRIWKNLTEVRRAVGAAGSRSPEITGWLERTQSWR